MKYIKEYLETVVKIKPLGELTTKEDELNGLSGEMAYIDGKCSDIFIAHADYANWIESKYEQKSVDKVIEPKFPKFKVGDWIAHNRTRFMFKVVVATPMIMTVVNTLGYHHTISADAIEKNYHLWSIADAKDGDVLQLGEVTAIFKEFIGNGNCKCYCSVCDGEFEIPSQNGADNRYGCHNAIPATTEQRDMLFKKMHEAGYMWNAEKKEVMKIVTPVFNIGDRIRYKGHACDGVITEITDTDYICGDTKLPISTQDKLELVEQKSSWSEEDEEMIQALNACIDVAIKSGMNYISFGSKSILIEKVKNWLKSFTEMMKGEKINAVWSQEAEKQGEQKSVVIIPKFRVGDEVITENEESLTITRIDEEGYWSNDLFICDFDSERIWNLVEQKSAWSEEDEQYLLICKNALAKYQITDKWDASIISRWLETKLKSLRPQPKQEWSEEDEKNSYHLKTLLENLTKDNKYEFRIISDNDRDKYTTWLKSVKDRVQPQNNEDLKKLKGE